ncbi:helix-turn-helix transcriptional regulator [Ralstonia chuxiongensis]|uniref:AlpA family phage regulatory protein n=1 Tax=Ralstonia chuxiongensis TaxID=2957504 RepID=A0AA41WY32_9RALS|nr:hypothetical protein [Ralstonia chuxiongensis]MCP1174484.1 hypothetical protein [Ralstonia chuxiongensis]
MRANSSEGNTDFRALFAKFDPLALISPTEFATLLGITTNAFYQRDGRGEFPRAVIRKNRCVRWRAVDVREWLQTLVPQEPARRDVPAADFNAPRRGRPRKSIDVIA